MAHKNATNVLIGGKVYTLSGQESEEYIQRVALYINNKIEELHGTENAKKLNTRLQSILLELNIADDFFKERERNSELNYLLELKDQEIESLNKALVQADIKMDEAKAQEDTEKDTLKAKIAELEKQVQSYKDELDEYIEIFDRTGN